MADQLFIQGRPASKEEITAILRADPVMQQLFQQARSMSGGEKEKEALVQQRARELGVQLPHDWSLDFDKGGWRVEKANFFNRNKDWIIPAAVGGVTLGMGAAGAGPLGFLGGGGSSAASGGGLAAAQAVEKGATTGLGTLGSGAAAAAAPSLLHSLLPTIISSGAGLGGAYLAARGVSNAAKTEAEQADRALQVQQQMYNQQRADFGPYRSMGQGAVEALGRGLGVEPHADTTIPGASNIPGLPNQPAQTANLATLGMGSQMVTLRAPNGETKTVPATQADHYMALGAQRV